MTLLHNSVAFEAFGARICVNTLGLFEEAFQPQLPPGSRPASGESYDTTYTVTAVAPFSESEPARYVLARDGVAMTSSIRLSQVQLELESDMHFHVARCARGYLFVHAGVVEWRGRAIVIPGRTYSGKSSLVLALVRAGATYFSDEFAVMLETGQILPYAKPLSERREGASPLLHAPDELGAAPAHVSVPLGLTAVIQFQSGAQWKPRPLSTAAALMALFANTLVAQTDPEFAMSVLTRAVEGSEALESERGDAAGVVADLLNAQRPLPK